MDVRWDVALTVEGNRVWISEAGEDELYCPECKGVMIPVRGEQIQHHFRHSADSECSGESALHWTKKFEIADALGGIGSVIVEGKIGDYVADVLFEDEWAFEVVFTNPPSEDKLRSLRENLVIFNFSDDSVWGQQDALFENRRFDQIVKRIGESIVRDETIDVCSVCREVKGVASRLKSGGRCFPCDFDIFIEDREKEKKIEEYARQYRVAKMR